VGDGGVVELIRVLPTVLWATVIVTAVLLFRRSIQHQLMPRLTRVRAFGIEVEAEVKEQPDRVSADAPAGTNASRTQVARQAARVADVIRGARVLLVNDLPREMTRASHI
jgi:hypothetical protein